jgi:hypothetical protein
VFIYFLFLGGEGVALSRKTERCGLYVPILVVMKDIICISFFSSKLSLLGIFDILFVSLYVNYSVL